MTGKARAGRDTGTRITVGYIAIVVLGGKGRACRELINNRGAAELVSLYVCFVPLASVDAGGERIEIAQAHIIGDGEELIARASDSE